MKRQDIYLMLMSGILIILPFLIRYSFMPYPPGQISYQFLNVFNVNPVVYTISLIILITVIYYKIFNRLSTAIFLLSPSYLFLTMTPTIHHILLPLVLLTYFLREKRFSYFLISLISFYNFTAGFSLFMVLLTENYILKKSNMNLLFFLPLLINIPKFNIINFNSLFSEFGSFFGLSVFLFLLSMIGIITYLNKPRFLVFIPTLSILISYFFLIDWQIVFYLNIILIQFAVRAILVLYNYKWNFLTVRNLTLVLIFCSLLFSYLSIYKEFIYQSPNQEMLESFNYFSGSETVLTTKENSIFLKYFTNVTIPNIDELSLNTTFYSRNFKTTINLLDLYNISRIYITKDMLEKYPWKESDEGLLFVMKNSETFKKTYSSDNIEVWEYEGFN